MVVQNLVHARQWVAHEGDSGFAIGRDAACTVQLPSQFISREHARVERCDQGWELVLAENVNPMTVNGTEVQAGRRCVLGRINEINIAEYALTIEISALQATASHDDDVLAIQRLLHINILRKLDLRLSGGGFDPIPARIELIDATIDNLLQGDFKTQCSTPPLSDALLDHAVRARLASKLASASANGAGPLPYSQQVQIAALEQSVAPLIQAMFNGQAPRAGIDLEQTIDDLMASKGPQLTAQLLENQKRYLINSYLKKVLFDMIFGYGPLQDLIDSPDVSEIMVVCPTLIYVERAGRVVRTRKKFTSPEAATAVLERIVAPMGRRIDRSQPLVDARLKDGSRVNAVIEPLAVRGACITIRKFPTREITVQHLIDWRSLNQLAATFLEAAVRFRSNIVIAGGTGSGKTTLLNALSGMIPSHERLVTIEDAAELSLQQEHVVTLETRPVSAEGTGAVTIRDLLKNALRMRPDRIIVGECRGGEALDMLQAMNTGHAGSMTTLHANSAQDVISRLETMVLTAADLPMAAVRQQVAQSLDLIVYIRRQPRGRRMITQISEVMRVSPTTGEVELRDLLRTDGPEDAAELSLTGYLPTFLPEMVAGGYLDLETWLTPAK
ncbi:MAG: ATPase, T2SS/T4P/T4SS family [Phycisphaeraceae bacterium]